MFQEVRTIHQSEGCPAFQVTRATSASSSSHSVRPPEVTKADGFRFRSASNRYPTRTAITVSGWTTWWSTWSPVRWPSLRTRMTSSRTSAWPSPSPFSTSCASRDRPCPPRPPVALLPVSNSRASSRGTPTTGPLRSDRSAGWNRRTSTWRSLQGSSTKPPAIVS